MKKLMGLLGQAVKGKQVDRLIQDIEENNQVDYKKVISSIEKERDSIKPSKSSINTIIKIFYFSIIIKLKDDK